MMVVLGINLQIRKLCPEDQKPKVVNTALATKLFVHAHAI